MNRKKNTHTKTLFSKENFDFLIESSFIINMVIQDMCYDICFLFVDNWC